VNTQKLDEYFKNRYKKARRLGLKLSRRDDFQKLVLKAREANSINPEEVSLNFNSRTNWYKSLEIRSDKWENDNLLEWRRKNAILKEQRQFSEARKLTEEFNAQIPINKFHNSIAAILRELSLESIWRQGIERYVLTNDVNKLLPKLGASIKSEHGENSPPAELSIRINQYTAQSDINAIWSDVKIMQRNASAGNKATRLSSSEKYEHALYAQWLLDENVSKKDIPDNLNEHFDLKDENQYDTDIDIDTLISNHKK
jgi:hypothetical protein